MPLSREKLQEYYALYGFAVHRRCERLLGCSSEADDALQDVFIRAHRYGETCRGETPLPWLYRIADHHCFEVLRKRRPAALQGDSVLGPRKHENLASLSSPERLRLVGQVLAACKEPLREVAVLYYVDEMTQEEVALVARCSRKTVKERLARFLETARSLLAASEVP